MTETLKKYFKGDGVIWAVIVCLTIISLLAVYSSTGTLAYRYQGGNTAYYILKHASFMLIGLIAIYISHLIPYKYYSRLSQLLLFIAVPMLAVTLVMGTTLNAATRWLTLPGLGITIQTSDFAKLALIMYIARLLSLKQDDIKDFKKAFVPIIIPVGIVCLLILPSNLSTSLMIFIVSIILMFLGRIPFKFIMLLGFAAGFFLLLFIWIAPMTKSGIGYRVETWKHRIENYFSSSKDEGEQNNFQAEQAKIAVATGGILGKGPGNSMQRNFLPHPYSDFIYAIIVEEYGLIGGIVVLFLYLFLLFRAGVIVRKADRTFPAFLTIGLALSLVFQAMINMAVAVNLFPVTGQTLPLVSMGGSSILFSSSALGIILSVSRGINKEEVESAVKNEEDNNEKQEKKDNSKKEDNKDNTTETESELELDVIR
jgi:cell division protein FtsW